MRILNLLLEGPLCVCHIQNILGETQPKVSRHLIAMREAGWLVSHRRVNWILYEISPLDHIVKTRCLAILKDLRLSEEGFVEDLLCREQILANTALEKKECPVAPSGEVVELFESSC